MHSPFPLLCPPSHRPQSRTEQPRMPRLYFFLALFLFSSFSFFLESLGLLALR